MHIFVKLIYALESCSDFLNFNSVMITSNNTFSQNNYDYFC